MPVIYSTNDPQPGQGNHHSPHSSSSPPAPPPAANLLYSLFNLISYPFRLCALIVLLLLGLLLLRYHSRRRTTPNPPSNPASEQKYQTKDLDEKSPAEGARGGNTSRAVSMSQAHSQTKTERQIQQSTAAARTEARAGEASWSPDAVKPPTKASAMTDPAAAMRDKRALMAWKDGSREESRYDEREEEEEDEEEVNTQDLAILPTPPETSWMAKPHPSSQRHRAGPTTRDLRLGLPTPISTATSTITTTAKAPSQDMSKLPAPPHALQHATHPPPPPFSLWDSRMPEPTLSLYASPATFSPSSPLFESTRSAGTSWSASTAGTSMSISTPGTSMSSAFDAPLSPVLEVAPKPAPMQTQTQEPISAVTATATPTATATSAPRRRSYTKSSIMPASGSGSGSSDRDRERSFGGRRARELGRASASGASFSADRSGDVGFEGGNGSGGGSGNGNGSGNVSGSVYAYSPTYSYSYGAGDNWPASAPGVPSSGDDTTVYGIELAEEIIVAAEGWRRHTRVYGGGVCQACVESERESERVRMGVLGV